MSIHRQPIIGSLDNPGPAATPIGIVTVHDRHEHVAMVEISGTAQQRQRKTVARYYNVNPGSLEVVTHRSPEPGKLIGTVVYLIETRRTV